MEVITPLPDLQSLGFNMIHSMTHTKAHEMDEMDEMDEYGLVTAEKVVMEHLLGENCTNKCAFCNSHCENQHWALDRNGKSYFWTHCDECESQMLTHKAQYFIESAKLVHYEATCKGYVKSVFLDNTDDTDDF